MTAEAILLHKLKVHNGCHIITYFNISITYFYTSSPTPDYLRGISYSTSDSVAILLFLSHCGIFTQWYFLRESFGYISCGHFFFQTMMTVPSQFNHSDLMMVQSCHHSQNTIGFFNVKVDLLYIIFYMKGHDVCTATYLINSIISTKCSSLLIIR